MAILGIQGVKVMASDFRSAGATPCPMACCASLRDEAFQFSPPKRAGLRLLLHNASNGSRVSGDDEVLVSGIRWDLDLELDSPPPRNYSKVLQSFPLQPGIGYAAAGGADLRSGRFSKNAEANMNFELETVRSSSTLSVTSLPSIAGPGGGHAFELIVHRIICCSSNQRRFRARVAELKLAPAEDPRRSRQQRWVRQR